MARTTKIKTHTTNGATHIGTGAITKTCTKSGVVHHAKSIDAMAEFFYRDKSQKDGFAPWSKNAERAYNVAYREALSNAKTTRKRDIDTTTRAGKMAAKKFDAAMTPERVTRKRNAGRVNTNA